MYDQLPPVTLPPPTPTDFERLRPYRRSLVAVGAVHTLLCAGTVFGWAALEATLRAEGRFERPDRLFALVFTLGAIGNYVSNLPCGALLDATGPRCTGVAASGLYALSVAAAARGCAAASPLWLAAGVFGIGFAGPAVQLPTLCLACLFEDGAAAMSVQAAAFDGGAFVFAAARELHEYYGVSSAAFLRGFLVVPAFTGVTALLLWPKTTLERADRPRTPGGPGSPFLRSHEDLRRLSVPAASKTLAQMVASRQFLYLAVFAAVHILKLNFVVTSVNAQTALRYGPGRAGFLVRAFGFMLPFGFVSAPVTAKLLADDPPRAFLAANALSFLYGAALCLGDAPLLLGVAFPLVALSRQLVYSSIFATIGAEFGFSRYGTLLGIVNLAVSLGGLAQYPLVTFSTARDSYAWANVLLLVLPLPLFAARSCLAPDAVAPPAKAAPKADEKSGLVRSRSAGLV